MRLIDIILFTIDGIKERKVRVVLNIIGIMIGGAAIISLVSVAEGMNLEINRQVELLGPKTIIITNINLGLSRREPITLTYRELDTVKNIPHVSVATPVISRATRIKINGRSAQVQVTGIIPEEYLKINKNLEISKGRFLQKSDVVSTVLGSNIAKPQSEKELIADIGDRLIVEVFSGTEIKSSTLRVSGILTSIGQSLAFSPDDSVYINLRTAQQIFNMGNRISSIIVEADDLNTIDIVVNKIREKLGDGVTIITSGFIRDTVGRVIGIVQAVLGSVSAISLVVAGVGIVNTMTISVMERTREIGILKAIGAKSRDILMAFLSESLLTGFSGGIVGSIVGVFMGQVISSLAQVTIGISLTPSTSFQMIAIVILFSMVTGILAGLYPAWRASNLNPVEALRYE
ncbi:ABC transporter permease [Candidatus Bathyarchaeota archaeon]|nr:ABC transporter permease [Candidatus Bathyarchaeota archaeon]